MNGLLESWHQISSSSGRTAWMSEQMVLETFCQKLSDRKDDGNYHDIFEGALIGLTFYLVLWEKKMSDQSWFLRKFSWYLPLSFLSPSFFAKSPYCLWGNKLLCIYILFAWRVLGVVYDWSSHDGVREVCKKSGRECCLGWPLWWRLDPKLWSGLAGRLRSLSLIPSPSSHSDSPLCIVTAFDICVFILPWKYYLEIEVFCKVLCHCFIFYTCFRQFN